MSGFNAIASVFVCELQQQQQQQAAVAAAAATNSNMQRVIGSGCWDAGRKHNYNSQNPITYIWKSMYSYSVLVQ